MGHVIIGMDPHKRSATIEIIDGRETVLAGGRFGTDRVGYKAMVALGRRYLEFAAANRAMFELMFRHDLLQGGGGGLRDASLPLFRSVVELVARAAPTADATVTAGALWANLHGIAQLWRWGSLQLAMGTDDVEPLLRAALDAHLGPANRRSR